MSTKNSETDKSNTARYSEEVWTCIRAVYEADGESSIERLLEIVRNETQIFELPTRQTVISRAKREKWERPTSLLQKTTAELTKIIQREKRHNMLLAGAPIFSDDKDLEDKDHEPTDWNVYKADTANIERREKLVETALSRVKKLLSSASNKKKQTAEIVKRNRAFNDRLHLIYDYAFDQVLVTNSLLTDLETSLALTERDKSNFLNINTMNKDLIMLMNETVAAREKLTRIDFALYGITPDDTKEPETGNRMKDLEDDTAYEEQMARLHEQQKAAAHRRRYIESGEMEAEVEKEIQAKMKEMGMDDDEDITEAEFTE